MTQEVYQLKVCRLNQISSELQAKGFELEFSNDDGAKLYKDGLTNDYDGSFVEQNPPVMTNLNLNDSFLNVRCDEIATIIRMTDKTAFLSCKSEYGTFEIKKSISNILNLIKTGQWELINNNLKRSKMKNLIETLRSKKTGYGHFSISIEMDGQEFKTTTTNTMAIDAAFDDCYDDEDNSGRYYETREEAQEALVNEILRANEIEL